MTLTPDPTRTASILLVDDDPGSLRVLHHILSDMAVMRFSTSGSEGLALARDWRPDLILLDIEMPDLDGVSFCQQLKGDPGTAETAVLFVTGHTEADMEITAFAAGAADFITKPVRPGILRARVATQLKIKQLTDALRNAAQHDDLTRLSNRAALNARLDWEWRRAMRSDTSLSVLMIDVDHFKQFNDQHGHLAGDDVLCRVAEVVARFARRSGEMAARFGGEEFALLLPGCNADEARNVAEALRAAVANLATTQPPDGSPSRVTVSVGVAARATDDRPEIGPSEPRGLALLEAADRALYRAKALGRNCVVCATEEDAMPKPAAKTARA